MKRALLVGIDDYPGAPLAGCVSDATEMAELLRRHADRTSNYDVRLVTSEIQAIDRPRLRSLLGELFENARDAELFFFFAGHGAQTAWGAELVTQDYTTNSLGVSLSDVIGLANESPAKEVVLVLDCCYSGDAANLAGIQSAAVAQPFRVPTAVLREGVTILAASRATEPSAEIAGHGAFTRLLTEGLEGAAADVLGNVTALSLYAFASRAFGAWEQRPVFKSHVLEPGTVRACSPELDRDLLRRLTMYFPTADARVRMSPAYEGEGRPLPAGHAGTAEQQAFDYFKRLRNTGLLATEEEADLYFVAIGSKEVFLTRSGRYFWRLAKEDRL